MTYPRLSLCLIVLIPLLAGPVLYLNRSTDKVLTPDDPRYEDVLCGPIALSTALGRLGIVKPPAGIAAACRVTARGVRMTELAAAAGKLNGVGIESGTFDLKDLKRCSGTAVLHINDDHFICVDPRESTASNNSGLVRVYQAHRPAVWWDSSRLADVWDGRALLLRRSPAAGHERTDGATKGNPKIQWDTCYLDNGVLDDITDDSTFTFRCTNVGSDILTIGDISTTCGCMDPVLSASELAPGESACVEVSVDLTGKDGFVFQQATVASNDPHTPVCVLSMALGIPRRRIVSSDRVRLPDLPENSETEHELLIADPGFDGFAIDADGVRVKGLPPHLIDRLAIELRHESVADQAEQHSGRLGFRVEPDDQLVTLTVQSKDGCPVGPFNATAIIPIIAGKHSRTVSVIVSGQVVPAVQPWPRLALLTWGDEESGEAHVQFKSLTDRPFTITGHTLQEGSLLSIHPGQTNRDFVVRGVFGETLPANPYREVVHFRLSDGTSIPLPVSAFQPSPSSL